MKMEVVMDGNGNYHILEEEAPMLLRSIKAIEEGMPRPNVHQFPMGLLGLMVCDPFEEIILPFRSQATGLRSEQWIAIIELVQIGVAEVRKQITTYRLMMTDGGVEMAMTLRPDIWRGHVTHQGWNPDFVPESWEAIRKQ